MKFIVNPEITALFPAICIGVVRGKAQPVGSDTLRPAIQELRKTAEQALRALNLDTSTLSAHPNVDAWRKAYQAFKVKAKKHKPTHEAMARRILENEPWPNINPIVDIYLTNQVEHLLPHGGYDSSRLEGTLVLAVSPGNEPFEALGGKSELTEADEVVYKDSARILTRRWNYRDAQHTCIRDDTTEFILMIESPSPEINVEAVRKATSSLASKFRTLMQGEFSEQVIEISPSNTEVTI